MPRPPANKYPFAEIAVGQTLEWEPATPVQPPTVRVALQRFRDQTLFDLGLHIDIGMQVSAGKYVFTRYPDRAEPRGRGRRPSDEVVLTPAGQERADAFARMHVLAMKWSDAQERAAIKKQPWPEMPAELEALYRDWWPSMLPDEMRRPGDGQKAQHGVADNGIKYVTEYVAEPQPIKGLDIHKRE